MQVPWTLRALRACAGCFSRKAAVKNPTEKKKHRKAD